MVIGALAGFIPKIEGFAPLPSASADAFMSMQGGHMALYFGAEYTIGKRLIASMSNDEFNFAVKNPLLFIAKIDVHYREITKVFEKYLDEHVDRIQQKVLEKAFEVEKLKVMQNVKLIKELPAVYWEAIWSVNNTLEQTFNPENPRDPRLPPKTTVPESEKDFLPPTKPTTPAPAPLPTKRPSATPKNVQTDNFGHDLQWYKTNATGRLVEATIASDRGWWWGQVQGGGVSWRTRFRYPNINIGIRQFLKAYTSQNYSRFIFSNPKVYYWVQTSKLTKPPEQIDSIKR